MHTTNRAIEATQCSERSVSSSAQATRASDTTPSISAARFCVIPSSSFLTSYVDDPAASFSCSNAACYQVEACPSRSSRSKAAVVATLFGSA